MEDDLRISSGRLFQSFTTRLKKESLNNEVRRRCTGYRFKLSVELLVRPLETCM